MISPRLTAPAAILVLAVTPAPAENPLVTLDELLDAAGFSEEDRERIHGGEIVSEGLDDDLTDTYLGVALAVHIDVPPMELLDYLREAKDHREDPDLLGFGDIDEADLDGSFAAIELTPTRATRFASCSPPSRVRTSTSVPRNTRASPSFASASRPRTVRTIRRASMR